MTEIVPQEESAVVTHWFPSGRSQSARSASMVPSEDPSCDGDTFADSPAGCFSPTAWKMPTINWFWWPHKKELFESTEQKRRYDHIQSTGTREQYLIRPADSAFPQTLSQPNLPSSTWRQWPLWFSKFRTFPWQPKTT